MQLMRVKKVVRSVIGVACELLERHTRRTALHVLCEDAAGALYGDLVGLHLLHRLRQIGESVALLAGPIFGRRDDLHAKELVETQLNGRTQSELNQNV